MGNVYQDIIPDINLEVLKPFIDSQSNFKLTLLNVKMPSLPEWLKAMEMIEGIRDVGLIIDYGRSYLKLLKRTPVIE